MKQAQITIFIVLGIVVMIIFGLVFFIRNATSDTLLEKKINKIYGDFLSSTDIKHITQNCLDKTAKEALLLVGLQGGRIYDYQIKGGYNIPSFYDVIPFNYTERNANGIIYNVSYGIKAPVNPPHPNPPDYPYNGSLVRDVSKLWAGSEDENPYDKLFSDVSAKAREKTTILADLCNKFGPNYPWIPGAQKTCETPSETNQSIQEYTRQYIEQNIENCINLTLKETSKYNITTKKLSSTVLMGEDDMLISLTYPIEISIKNKPPITKYLDFNIRPKIRLKILHEIAYHLIGYDPNGIKVNLADSSNIFFNMEKDDPNNCFNSTDIMAPAIPCLKKGINVFKLPDYCLNHNCNFNNKHYNYSDIVVIEDNKSIINGKPYRFQFAIENRRPTLDFIDESVSPDTYYYWYINTTYGKNLTEVYSNVSGHPISDEYNIITEIPSATLEIFPLGIDPDEDNLTYRYDVISSSRWSNSNFEESDHYVHGVHSRKYVSGFVSDHLIAKDVRVAIGGGSSGSNVIRINISDNEGLYDYQDVIIEVFQPI